MSFWIAIRAEFNPRLCFIARPYREEADKVEHCIVDAAAKLKFEIEVANWDHAGTPFIQRVWTLIRNSRIVVALIPAAGNGNVMYEVGFAHSLKKPVLILTDGQPGDLPSNLSGISPLQYTQDGLTTRAGMTNLTARIESAIRDTLALSTTDENLQVMDDTHVLLGNPITRHHFRTVFRLAQEISSEMAHFQHEWLDRMKKLTDDLFEDRVKNPSDAAKEVRSQLELLDRLYAKPDETTRQERMHQAVRSLGCLKGPIQPSRWEKIDLCLNGCDEMLHSHFKALGDLTPSAKELLYDRPQKNIVYKILNGVRWVDSQVEQVVEEARKISGHLIEVLDDDGEPKAQKTESGE